MCGLRASPTRFLVVRTILAPFCPRHAESSGLCKFANTKQTPAHSPKNEHVQSLYNFFFSERERERDRARFSVGGEEKKDIKGERGGLYSFPTAAHIPTINQYMCYPDLAPQFAK
jgi:hypothetical protein